MLRYCLCRSNKQLVHQLVAWISDWCRFLNVPLTCFKDAATFIGNVARAELSGGRTSVTPADKNMSNIRLKTFQPEKTKEKLKAWWTEVLFTGRLHNVRGTCDFFKMLEMCSQCSHWFDHFSVIRHFLSWFSSSSQFIDIFQLHLHFFNRHQAWTRLGSQSMKILDLFIVSSCRFDCTSVIGAFVLTFDLVLVAVSCVTHCAGRPVIKMYFNQQENTNMRKTGEWLVDGKITKWRFANKQEKDQTKWDQNVYTLCSLTNPCSCSRSLEELKKKWKRLLTGEAGSPTEYHR